MSLIKNLNDNNITEATQEFCKDITLFEAETDDALRAKYGENLSGKLIDKLIELKISPKNYDKFKEFKVTPEAIEILQELQFNKIKEFLDDKIKDPELIKQYLAANLKLSDVKLFNKFDISDIKSISKLIEKGLTSKLLSDYEQSGVKSKQDLIKLFNSDITPQKVKEFTKKTENAVITATNIIKYVNSLAK